MTEEYIKRTIAILKTFPNEDPVLELGFHLSELEEILSWKRVYDNVKEAKTKKGLSLEETKELIELIENFGEDSMTFYCKWQEKRPIDFPETSDMRAIRKYVEEFGVFKKLLKEEIEQRTKPCPVTLEQKGVKE